MANPVSAYTTSLDSARPMRLVYRDENGRLKTDPEAIDALRQLKGPAAVVSLYGRACWSKSFILNQLLGRSNEFQVVSNRHSCTKGLWMWIAPCKRIASDGTESNLLLLDCEEVDACDRMATYNAQIFSLALVLSSVLIYDQIGGIDEAALDYLSCVTQLTKHIRVGPAEDHTLSDLRQFSPVFVWLLTNFYLDLVEGNARLTLQDYLELALKPISGGGQEIRESIRCLFLNQECFALVRPLNEETDLQNLDQIPLEKLCPEFRFAIDAFGKFVSERARPKQVGGTNMSGPILAGITKSFLEAFNNGDVATLMSSWQCVEESECRRAYDMATQVYTSGFDRTKPLEEVLLREAHDEAVHKAGVAFNESAVGIGSTRQMYEGRLLDFLGKAFGDYKRIAFMEADLRCSRAIEDMVQKLQVVSQAPDANIDNVIKVLDGLLVEYEASVHGPAKWQKLSSFLRKSLQDILVFYGKNYMARVLLENGNLMQKCQSMEDTIQMLKNKLEQSEKLKNEYQKHYEDAISDMNKLSDCYKNRISNIESKYIQLEHTCSCFAEALEPTRLEALGWQKKYEEMLAEKNVGDARANAEISILKSKGSVTEAGVAAAHEQAWSAQKEAKEWQMKCEHAFREAEAASQKEMSMENSLKMAQVSLEAMQAEFSRRFEEKENEIQDKAAELASLEQRVATLSSDLKGAESEIKRFSLESNELKLQIREWDDKYRCVKSAAESLENEAQMLRQEKTQLEQKHFCCLEKLDNVCERLKASEIEVTKLMELADSYRQEALAAKINESELQQSTEEKSTGIESAKIQIENLEKQKLDLVGEVERFHVEKQDAISKIASLETRIREREEGIVNLKKKKCAWKENMVKTNLNSMHMVSCGFSNEVAPDPNPKTPQGKRLRLEAVDASGCESVQDMEIGEDLTSQEKKKPKKGTGIELGSSSMASHTKLTVVKLRQELTKQGFGAELLQLKSPRKKDLLELYEKFVLRK